MISIKGMCFIASVLEGSYGASDLELINCMNQVLGSGRHAKHAGVRGSYDGTGNIHEAHHQHGSAVR